MLHENGWIAEGLERFGAGARKGLRELVRRTYKTNPVTAASGGGLNQKRIAQALGMALRVGEGFHRPIAPGRYRYLRLLGQAFRGDLVAHPPHHIAIRADEHDTQFAAKVGECGVLGDKSPSYPDRVRARGHQRPFEPAIVNVTALGLLGNWIEDLSGAETNRLVGLAHEHAVAVRLGEKCNGAQRRAVFLIEIARGVDETHGGFAAIHDGHALKFVFHKSPDQRIVRTKSRTITLCSSRGDGVQ